MDMLQSINPANGETLSEHEQHTDAEVEAALTRAQKAFESNRLTSFADRADRMRAVADVLEDRKEKYAHLMTAEMGKPIKQARAEVEKCALACRFYADRAEGFLADERVEDDPKRYVRHLPIGPVLAVMPWNFPFWQVIRFAAPNLMAGNTGVLKHASNVTGCALAIQDLFEEAGFTPGSFETLKLSSSRMEKVIRDDRIRAVTLTGSEKAGSAVAAVAGEVIKKTVLELGGSDAFIVMPSADIEAAAKVGVDARLTNSGQSCIAAKRFLVHADVYDTYRDAFIAELERQSVGDPTLDETDVGPLVSADACSGLDAQVKKTVSMGGVRVTGAKPMDRPGAFFEPGVIEDIPAQSPGAVDELFGPVALFSRVRSLADAIHLANSHRYGLGSAIFTQDEDEIETAVNGLDAGTTAVNQKVASTPELPFGGVKASGYGRELARDGALEFTNSKAVAIK
ncbi:MAG: aldehyde dehydrogenase family protein [Alphaproteobacteria bacterium]|nr:aldehyde dehydrogenase family protein [Alphaproteobacteria bacterium]